MSNDKNNIMDNDEYQFPKDEYLTQSASATAAPDVDSAPVEDTVEAPKKPGIFTRFPILKNRKFLGGMALLVLLIVGMNMMHHKDAPVKKQPAMTATPVITQPVVKAPVPQVLNQLDSLKNTQQTSASTITQMKRHISMLHDALLSSSQQNARLNQAVSLLSAQIKSLHADVEKNTKSLASKHGSKHAVYHAPPVLYTVKAVVDGRAWLMGSNEQSVSVAIGDKISNYYGNVRAIDTASGHVITSSGKVIAYGSNDS